MSRADAAGLQAAARYVAAKREARARRANRIRLALVVATLIVGLAAL